MEWAHFGGVYGANRPINGPYVRAHHVGQLRETRCLFRIGVEYIREYRRIGNRIKDKGLRFIIERKRKKEINLIYR